MRIAHGETAVFHVCGGGLSRAQSGERVPTLFEDGKDSATCERVRGGV